MQERRRAPYGTWRSPISADSVVAGAIGFQQIALDGDCVYWTERRPGEGGRYVLVSRMADGTIVDLIPPPWNVRTTVHEYGGDCFTVVDGTVYFSNFADQLLYAFEPGGEPRPLSAAGLRYADPEPDYRRKRLILVREDHRDAGHEATNTIVAMAMDGSDERVLASGYDFYSTPRLSPDGMTLVWLAWNHPNMPWDSSELWMAQVSQDGGLKQPVQVAGGNDESIFQPSWSPGGSLHWVSDRSDWWNLYRLRGGAVEALCPMEAEFGAPQWQFGMSTYGFVDEQTLLCAHVERGVSHLAVLDTESGMLRRIGRQFSAFGGLHVSGPTAWMVAGSAVEAPALVCCAIAADRWETVRTGAAARLDPRYLSVPEHIRFATEHGLSAYGYLYLPHNPDYEAPAGEKPPLLVNSHGGPTGRASGTLNAEYQYWTSRGFAILDVDYGGSSGYGRAYRQRLTGLWGIVDVDDCVNGAKHLVERGMVDANRLVIEGGSAGGFTTLAVLTFRDTFKAGASYYGVSDLESMARDTHKFESRYLDGLIGPYPARRDLYLERSPIRHVDRLACPMILFQGLEDKVVPPDQAVTMYEAVKAKGLPVAYLPFAGEQHGFRAAKNIKRALEAEFYFFARIFGYVPADEIEPVEIANLH
jgi:dipeptidyl aminopeptidase/acylaminoacyl peptidase